MKKALLLGLLFLWKGVLWAAPAATDPQSVGKIVFARGEAVVLRVEEGQVKSLTNITFNDDIYAMDTLQTKKGEMRVLFGDQTVLSLGENSKVIITEHVYKAKQGVRKSIFDILKGKVRTIVEKIPNEKDSDVVLRTPTAVAGIRGTDVGILVNDKETLFLCFDGLIETWFREKEDQKVLVPKGMMTVIKKGPPAAPVPIDEEFEKQLLFSYGIQDILDQDGMNYLGLGRDPRTGRSSRAEGIQQGQGRYAGPTRQRLVDALVFSPLLPGGNNSTPSDLGAPAGTAPSTPEPLTPPTPPVPPVSPEPPPANNPPERPVSLPLGFPQPG